jgi:hypothetical protein
VRQKYLGFFSEMVAVSQYLLRITGVVDLQHRSSILELPLEPYKRVRSELSSAPRLFHLGRVVDQVDLRVSTVHANGALSGLIRLESLVAEATSAPQQTLIAVSFR